MLKNDQSGNFAVTTCGSTFDTVLGIFLASDLSIITTNDDDGFGICGTSTVQSSIVGVALSSGTTYIIAVVRTLNILVLVRPPPLL